MIDYHRMENYLWFVKRFRISGWGDFVDQDYIFFWLFDFVDRFELSLHLAILATWLDFDFNVWRVRSRSNQNRIWSSFCRWAGSRSTSSECYSNNIGKNTFWGYLSLSRDLSRSRERLRRCRSRDDFRSRRSRFFFDFLPRSRDRDLDRPILNFEFSVKHYFSKVKSQLSQLLSLVLSVWP